MLTQKLVLLIDRFAIDLIMSQKVTAHHGTVRVSAVPKYTSSSLNIRAKEPISTHLRLMVSSEL